MIQRLREEHNPKVAERIAKTLRVPVSERLR
jgi:hypothetical protein